MHLKPWTFFYPLVRKKKNTKPQALEIPRRKPEDEALAEVLRPRPLLGWGGQDQNTMTAEGSSLHSGLCTPPLEVHLEVAKLLKDTEKFIPNVCFSIPDMWLFKRMPSVGRLG